MKSLKVSMMVDEFDLMPQKFGWKHEYWKGFARVSPRHNGVFVKVPITKRDVLTHFEIQPISAIGLDELRELFYASFKNSVEYCDYKQIDVKQSAKKNIDHFWQ
ncbi:MAG: hypothetical protein H7Z37_11815 [Pyrinomonadaceae bacterium]|nr:hypothetical protein [Pyrinomonadaceae bacterium]